MCILLFDGTDVAVFVKYRHIKSTDLRDNGSCVNEPDGCSSIFPKSDEKIKVSLKSDKSNRYFT